VQKKETMQKKKKRKGKSNRKMENKKNENVFKKRERQVKRAFGD
jgi:hypothetical protein